MEEKITDIAIIGGGPGGYVAGIKAGQLKLKVLLIEKENLGGICLNVGCIPSKSLIEISKHYERLKNLDKLGIKIKIEEVNWELVQNWKDSVIMKLTTGIAQLLKGNNVEVIKGKAEIIDKNELIVNNNQTKIKYKRLVIATGSYPIELSDIKYDHDKVIDSTDFLSIKEIPQSLVVVGGGYIGLELGSIMARFGSKVTVVEMLPQILPGFDIDVVRVIERRLKKMGVDIYVNSIVKRAEYKDKLEIIIDNKGVEKIILADKMLVCIGRKPLTNGFGLEKLGVIKDEKGFIKVDNRFCTNIENIYAIGDVAGMPMLAHKASREGEIIAEILSGKNSSTNYKCIPSVVYTEPEIAIVGLTENQANEKGLDVIIGKFPFIASGRALTMQETDGFIKIIANKKTHEILGVTITGPNASDLIGEATLAIEKGTLVEDIANTIHPHPSISEALMEAAKVTIGEPIHFIKTK